MKYILKDAFVEHIRSVSTREDALFLMKYELATVIRVERDDKSEQFYEALITPEDASWWEHWFFRGSAEEIKKFWHDHHKYGKIRIYDVDKELNIERGLLGYNE